MSPITSNALARLVLLVEDDKDIARFVSNSLSKAGYRVSHTIDKPGALRQFDLEIPDLVILDVMLPGEDGFRILGAVRERFNTPVIMLTALGEVSDRVKGLMGGADDYLPKPFHTSELLARIEAVLRRHAGQAPGLPKSEELFFDGWRIDARARTLTNPSQVAILLTSGEFDILWALSRHAGEVLSRDRLVQMCQNQAVEPYDRRVDTLISRLRRKLKDPSLIKTVRNCGYVFTPLVTTEPS